MFSVAITYPTGILWTINLEAVNESWGVLMIHTPFFLAFSSNSSDTLWEPVIITKETLRSTKASWTSGLSPTIAISPSSINPFMLSGCIAATQIFPGNFGLLPWMYNSFADKVSTILSIEVLLLARITLSHISIYEEVKLDTDSIPNKWSFESATGRDWMFLSLIMFQAIFNDISGVTGLILSIFKSSTFNFTVSKYSGASAPK